jgi:uncharacterized membrane protein HdeD (DUF308 family)
MHRSHAKLPVWYRAVAVVVGLISIALAFVVIVFPAFGLVTLVFLLGFALLVIGVDRLIAGITGHPFGWLPGIVRDVTTAGSGPGGSPPLGPAPPP